MISNGAPISRGVSTWITSIPVRTRISAGNWVGKTPLSYSATGLGNRQYGVDVVARAFVKASRENPNLRLLLLGSGSQGEQIEAILDAGGVLDRVHMPGQIPFAKLPDYYRAADLYISASHTDGSSVSLMEAMGCGVPAAVSNIAGNLEWIAQGEQGWIFNDGDDTALAGIMQRASQSRVDLAVMSLKARHKAEKFANWKINQARMLDGYKKVVSS